MKNPKTKDGFDVTVNEEYYLENGACAVVDEYATNSKGDTVFMVIVYYEGESMYVTGDGGCHSEHTSPWECESEPFAVKTLYKNEPIAKLGKIHQNLSDKILHLTHSHGSLISLIKDQESKLSDVRKHIKETTEGSRKIFLQNGDLIKENNFLLVKKDSLTSTLSELEDSITHIKEEDVSELISKDELIKLRKIEFKMECLEAGGVDNWGDYGLSLDDYRSRYPEG